MVDADIQSYFDTIDRSLLMVEVKKEVADGRVLDLLERLLQQPVMDGLREWTPEQGTPQGSVISPMLANVYLHPVDLALKQAGFEMVRYADDLVILCETEAQAHEALRLLEQAMMERRLTLHPQKTRVVDATQPGGFDFLGYHFEQGERRPRKKSLRKFKDRSRALTPRNSGHSLRVVISRLNATIRGWFGYFKHSHRWVFSSLDGWIRRRLRAILLRRHRTRGIGRGKANIRWPNAYFVALGLFTMTTAREAARQPR